MDYARLVLQRWDMGADQIPDLEVYGPPPIARMTELLFGEDGVYGPDIRARIEHQSSIDVFAGARRHAAARSGPRRACGRSTPATSIEGDGWTVTVGHASHVQPHLECLAFRLDSDEGSVCYSGDSGAVRRARRAGARLRRAHPHEPPLQRHRADAGLPRGVRQPPRQRA